MRKLLLLSATALAATAMTAPAGAAILADFIQGGQVSDLTGYTVINSFDSSADITGTKFQVQSVSNGDGAIIPLDDSKNGSFLTVLTNGSAKILLPKATGAFAFEWGSLDTYNMLTIELIDGSLHQYIPGTNPANTLANGNQLSANTNGTFLVTANAGERFKSITLSSGGNSFEADNLAVQSVPEPATWAMMILGMGAVGGALRRPRRTAIRFA